MINPTEPAMHYLESNKDYRDQSLRQDTELATAGLLEDTAQHYDDCYQDYLFAWCNKNNLALHYGYWDQPEPYSHHQALINKNQQLYKLAGIQADARVLDAGCGIGGSSIWMAKEHGNTVTGITISASQANYAKQHAKRHKVSKLAHFEVTDFCQTPFADESFDVVWALESSCHALNKGDFLKEAYRLLRKGGRLVVCDGFILKREFTDEQWQAIVICLNGWAVPNLCSRSEFTQLLEDQGFVDTQYTDISKQTLASSVYMDKVAKRLKPVQKISQWLGLRSKAQTANYLVGEAQYTLFKEKLTEYGIFTATK